MQPLNLEKAKELVKQAVEHLLEAELLEENGWSKEDVEILEYVSTTEFDIQFK